MRDTDALIYLLLGAALMLAGIIVGLAIGGNIK